MINGHEFTYPKVKPAFWLNPQKLVSKNINGTIVDSKHSTYGTFANDCHFLSTLNWSIQFITNCEQQSGFIQIQEKIIPVFGTCTKFNIESWPMTTLLGNPNQEKLCHANIKFEREILSVTRNIARKHATSRSRKILPIFKTCYFCVKLKT